MRAFVIDDIHGARLIRTILLAACIAAAFEPAAAQTSPVYECAFISASDGNAMTGGINWRSDVVGWSVSGVDGGPTRWKGNGRTVYLSSDGYGRAVDINDAGVTVGHGYDHDGVSRATTWRRGEVNHLPSLTKKPSPGWAHAINRHGDVVGHSQARGNPENGHAVLWRAGQAIDLGALGRPKDLKATYSDALDINDAGQVVGYSHVSPGGPTHPVRWDDPQTLVDLGPLPGGANSIAHAINRSGLVVGASEFGPSDDYHAVAWGPDGIRDLGTLPGHTRSWARAVNAHGVIVGEGRPTRSGDQVALIWLAPTSAPVALQGLVDGQGCVDDAGQAYTLQRATGINDAGVIAAYGMRTMPDGGHQWGALRLTPVADTSWPARQRK